MTSHIDDVSRHKAAKVAGFMFLFAFIVPTLNWAFVLSTLGAESVTATANNIMANEFQFRFGLTIELLMAVGLIVLGTALYIVLKPVNKSYALLALVLKVVEAALAAAIVLASFLALQVTNGYADAVGLIFNAHTALYAIPMVFLGLDMMIFSYLFLKSGYIPRALACFGILSFALILIHALMVILAPEYATMPISQIVCFAPSGLFEITIGIWLLSKGLKVQQGQSVFAS